MSWDTEFPIPYQIRILARKQAGFSLQQLGRHPPCRRLILELIDYTVLGSHFLYFFILLIRRKMHTLIKKSCFKLKHLPLISKSTKRKHGIWLLLQINNKNICTWKNTVGLKHVVFSTTEYTSFISCVIHYCFGSDCYGKIVLHLSLLQPNSRAAILNELTSLM